MSETLFITHDWPRAIIHVDGDAFFTSCEEAIQAEFRGKPIITGGERGIVACASYAAKALGIKRGVALHEAKQICPELVVLPSDSKPTASSPGECSTSFAVSPPRWRSTPSTRPSPT